MKNFTIALGVGWLLLCAWVFWGVRANREAVWHLSESAPLEPIARVLPDDGSWEAWRAATVRFNAHGGEELAVDLADVLKVEADPGVHALDKLRPRLGPRLAALPDPEGMSGWTVEPEPLDGSGEPNLPPQSMGPARAWVAQAWLLAQDGDPAAAQAALRRAHRVGVLFEHSGASLIAVMIGVGTQRLVLANAIALADRVPLDALLDDVVAARRLPSGVPAGLHGDCETMERMLESLDPSAQTAGAGSVLPTGKVPFVYSPRRTVARHRWICRQRIAWAQAAPADRQPLPHEALWSGTDPRHWLDNPAGRVLMDISGVDPSKMQARRDDLGPLADQLAAQLAAGARPRE